MTDIVINLDVPLFVPGVDVSLLEMVKRGGFQWPVGSTCLSQESDGAIFWWSAPIQEVREARKIATLDDGLMPIIGLGRQVHVEYFLSDDFEVVANDWKSAVVTFDQFIGIDSQKD